jgi:hypothetical protein
MAERMLAVVVVVVAVAVEDEDFVAVQKWNKELNQQD